MTTDLSVYIKSLREVNDTHQVIESLRTSSLSIPEKNLVYLYLYPRPLLDRELPGRIQENRVREQREVGWLEPEISEVALLIEAYRTQQYRRFIKHLLHTFTGEEAAKNISPILGYAQDTCGLCGKRLFEWGAWESEVDKFKNTPSFPERERKEYLSFGGKGSNISLCLDCIVQLQEVNRILETIEPGYLRNRFYE